MRLDLRRMDFLRGCWEQSEWNWSLGALVISHDNGKQELLNMIIEQLAEWLGNKLESATKHIRSYCFWDEERRRKGWPISLTLDGLPKGAIIMHEGNSYRLLEDVMTLSQSNRIGDVENE